MCRLKLMVAGLMPIGLAVLAFAALAIAAPTVQEPEEPGVSRCEPAMTKVVTPDRLLLGATAKVTLVITHTCPGTKQPVDIMFLVDASNSMTRDSSGGVAPPGDPGDPGDPGRTATPIMMRTPPPLIAGFDRDLLHAIAFGPDQEPGLPPPSPGDPSPIRDDPPGCERNDATGPGGPGGPPGPVPPGPGPGPLPLRDVLPAGMNGANGVLQERTPPPVRTEPPSEPTVEPPFPPEEPPGPRPTTSPDEGEPGGSEDLVRETQRWLRDFMDDERIKADIDSGNLRLGLVSFNKRALSLVKLSEFDQAHRVGTSASRLRGQDETRVDVGFQRATTELAGKTKVIGGRTGRKQFVVILSDGAFCKRDLRRVRESREIQIATVSFGRTGWERRLAEVASERRYAFDGRRMKEFIEMYEKEFAATDQPEIERMVIQDELRENMELVPGSVSPPPTSIDERTIRWDALPPGTAITTTPRITISPVITLEYEIKPMEPGTHFISYEAFARWRDTQDLPGFAMFPPAVIDVIPPTATPTNTATPTDTPTATPTATPTPTPQARYLPVAYKMHALKPPRPDECTPEKQKIDVILIVDTSTSMTEIVPGTSTTKLAAAIQAAKALVGLLKLPDTLDGDQAAVVGFNSTTTTLRTLTGDRASILESLDALAGTADTGTHIDAGLNAAIDELVSERRRVDSTASIVLVTDGRHSGPGGEASVLVAAARARSLGFLVFTVGLGADIDADLLRQVATVPENYRAAPDASELVLIYETIAREIPCP